MKIDVDRVRWLEIIRMSNLVLSRIVTHVCVSRSGRGLHLFSPEQYYEPIECPNRAEFRRMLGYEITFDGQEWQQTDLIGLLNLVNEVS